MRLGIRLDLSAADCRRLGGAAGRSDPRDAGKYDRSSGVSPSAVEPRAHGLHRLRQFQLSADPTWVAIYSCVELNIHAPVHPVARSVNEKNRTHVALPLKKSRGDAIKHDYSATAQPPFSSQWAAPPSSAALSVTASEPAPGKFIVEAALLAGKAGNGILDNYTPRPRSLPDHPQLWTFALVAKLLRRLKRCVFRSIVDQQVVIRRFIAEHNKHLTTFEYLTFFR